MNWAVWLVFGVAGAVLIASAFLAGGSARFWWDMAGIAWGHLLPAIKAQIARDMTDPDVDRRNKEAARNPGGSIPAGTGVTTGKVVKVPAATRRRG